MTCFVYPTYDLLLRKGKVGDIQFDDDKKTVYCLLSVGIYRNTSKTQIKELEYVDSSISDPIKFYSRMISSNILDSVIIDSENFHKILLRYTNVTPSQNYTYAYTTYFNQRVILKISKWDEWDIEYYYLDSENWGKLPQTDLNIFLQRDTEILENVDALPSSMDALPSSIFNDLDTDTERYRSGSGDMNINRDRDRDRNISRDRSRDRNISRDRNRSKDTEKHRNNKDIDRYRDYRKVKK